MRKGMRHPNAKAVSLRGKPGRPKSVPLAVKVAACEICRNLVITKAKKCSCSKGCLLDPRSCGQFDPATIERASRGASIGRSGR